MNYYLEHVKYILLFLPIIRGTSRFPLIVTFVLDGGIWRGREVDNFSFLS